MTFFNKLLNMFRKQWYQRRVRGERAREPPTMGNKSASSKKGLVSRSQTDKKHEREAMKLLGGESMENLKEDWCRVKKIEYQTIDQKIVPSRDISKTSISKAEFKQLMSSDMTDRDLDALFSLYDYDHDGTITWREYICVITLLMAGSTMEKVKRM
eukprot:TRINITY_DN530_c0_g1_i2.p1 TRINITY_DN530_c0_g1~~TRINITY_DN530_c0_g1_i2.p1  ORF type:complete len:156 (-),score=42.41 TRINITY_DN530_c0_g1_i2:188-655(-)